MNMHVTQSCLKNIIALQEEYKKKNKQINNECSTSLTKIKEIDDQILKNENNEADHKELETIRFHILIKPFLVALYEKEKVSAYVFEALRFLISNSNVDDATITNLVALLQKHLNTNKEQGVRIIQLLHLLLGYECVAGEVIANIFYTCMTLLDCKIPILVSTAKSICKQIVFDMFLKFNNAHLKFKKDGIATEEYKIYHGDCKTLLNDIHEYLSTFSDKEENFILALDFLEQILKNQEIYNVQDVKEVFVKIINKTLVCKEHTRSTAVEDRINRLTLLVIKSKAFLDESPHLILKSGNVLHLFDSDMLKFIIENENNKNAYFEILRKISNDDNSNRSNMLSVMNHLVEYLKESNTTIESIEDNALHQAEHNEVFDFTIKLFIKYLDRFDFAIDEFRQLNDLFLFIQTQITHFHQNFENLLKQLLAHSERFVLEVAKYLILLKKDLKYEWEILFKNANYNKKELQSFLIEQSESFTESELFYLLNAIQDKEILKSTYNAINKHARDITPLLLTILNAFYNDLDEFTFFIGDVVDNPNICNENLNVIFSVILLRCKNRSINELAKQIHGFEYVFEHNQFAEKTDVEKLKIPIEAKQKLIIAMYNHIRVSNEKIINSWNIIIDILDESCNEDFLSDDIFNSCQLLTENFYPLINEAGRKKINKILCTVCNINIDKINLVLKSLNILNSISKHLYSEKNNFEEYKDLILSINTIILQNRLGFCDSFETGFEIICSLFLNQNNINLNGNDKFLCFMYNTILPGIVYKGKELFDTVILDYKELVYDERKRYKIILQMIIMKINKIFEKYGTESNDACTFLGTYIYNLREMICFSRWEHERGFDVWKNEIAVDCIEAYQYASKPHIDHIDFTLQNIPIFNDDECNINEAEDNLSSDSLYYKIEVYIRLIHILENNQRCDISYDNFARLFEIKDSTIRDRLFDVISKKSQKENVIAYYTKWLKLNDNDIVLRVLSAIRVHFCKNTTEKPQVQSEELTEVLDASLRLSVRTKQTEIVFGSNFEHSNESSDIIDLLKTLVVIANETDAFWVQAVTCVLEILINKKEDKDIVECIVKLSEYLCKKHNEKPHKNIATFYGSTSEVMMTKQNSVNERIKEKILMKYADAYLQTIVHQIYKYKNDDKERDQFALSSFSFIYDMSYVKPGNFRERLSNKCLSALFKYSRFTKPLLLVRIKQSMDEYNKEIHVFKHLYPRCKKAEMNTIFEYLSENPILVNELKFEIIECLCYNDQEIIDKIRICLLKGLQ